jgi:hypothetical protein
MAKMVAWNFWTIPLNYLTNNSEMPLSLATEDN